MRAVLRRELVRICRRPIQPLLLLVLPALALFLAWSIFSHGTPRDLPVAVVDLDHSALSRQWVRMVDATPAVRVAARPPDPATAVELVLSGQAHAWLLLPEGFERSVRRGERASVLAHLNAQRLAPASLLRRDLQAATASLSAGIELRRLRAQGETRRSAAARFEPIRVDLHTLYNPELHYGSFLTLTLFPTLLHVFVLLAAVDAVGSELREGTAGEWLAVAEGSLARAVAGKLVPGLVAALATAAAAGGWLFGPIGVPRQGSPLLLAVATALLIAAYQALAVALVAITANLRFATSVAAFFASPAFAFAGITFPTLGMPALARTWGCLLPLTHHLELLLAVTLKDAALAEVWPSLLALGLFPLALLPLVWRRLLRVVREPGYWGRA